MGNRNEVIDRRKSPFVMVTKKVLEDESLKTSEKIIYSILCMYADNNTSECWPSKKTLINKSGVSNRTLDNGLKVLESKTYIKVERRYKNNGGQLSNKYVLLDVN